MASHAHAQITAVGSKPAACQDHAQSPLSGDMSMHPCQSHGGTLIHRWPHKIHARRKWSRWS